MVTVDSWLVWQMVMVDSLVGLEHDGGLAFSGKGTEVHVQSILYFHRRQIVTGDMILLSISPRDTAMDLFGPSFRFWRQITQDRYFYSQSDSPRLGLPSSTMLTLSTSSASNFCGFSAGHIAVKCGFCPSAVVQPTDTCWAA